MLAFALVLAACDSGAPATATPAGQSNLPTPAIVNPGQPRTPAMGAGVTTPIDTDSGAVAPPTVNENIPTPTRVTTTSTGPKVTALQALAQLKTKALAWQQ